MSAITREMFIEATGREPDQDDLERCNCQLAGRIFHECCGWDEAHNKPMFETFNTDAFRLHRVRP